MNINGKVGVFQHKWITDSITRPSNTTDYAAGDAISEVTSNDMFTFADIAGDQPGDKAGTILTATLSSSADAAFDSELWLFRAAPAEVSDNSAWSASDSEILECIGIIEFPSSLWKSASASSACHITEVNLDFVTDTGRDLYGQLVTRSAYTPTSAEVFQIAFTVNQS